MISPSIPGHTAPQLDMSVPGYPRSVWLCCYVLSRDCQVYGVVARERMLDEARVGVTNDFLIKGRGQLETKLNSNCEISRVIW